MSFKSMTVTQRRRLWLWVALLAGCGALSLLWSFSPARELIELETLVAWLQGLGREAAAPWLVLAAFVVGGLLALPVTLLVVVSIVILGPLSGFASALAGAVISAGVGFGVGRTLGHRALARVPGSRIHDLSLRLSNAGVIVIASLRMVPVAHFTMISLVAGASHIRLRDFLAGTLLGMAPGIGVIALFFDRVLAVNARPGPKQYLLLALVSIVMLSLLIAMRWFGRRVVEARARRRANAAARGRRGGGGPKRPPRE